MDSGSDTFFVIPANPKTPTLLRAIITSLPASAKPIHQLAPMHRSVILGFTGIEGGFPHSEILGSKLVRSSPRLIAAYHVLHRLSAPRHPPNALMTLDHSHGRCPPHKQQIIDRKTFFVLRKHSKPACGCPQQDPCFQKTCLPNISEYQGVTSPLGSRETRSRQPSDIFPLHNDKDIRCT